MATIRDATARLHVAATRDAVRVAEALAAGAYWSALSPVSVRFARRDVERVPAHWRTLGSRTSPLTGYSRLASNPANAILNDLYAILQVGLVLDDLSRSARLGGSHLGCGAIVNI